MGGSAGGSGSAAMRGASGGVYSATTADGASGYGAGAAAAASRAFGARGHGSGTVIGSAGAGGSSLGFGRRPPGRHRQGDVADGEPGAVPPRASVRTADVPFRRGADEEIIDAEIVEE
ncbi:conserved hypothetical protein [Frankia canadensis]|uniref:Uncharacterized protein n=1 Tax=Frankia canadensis TaxID=1836972 RepID=A0A2I2KYN8_9ACTN|nr:conserved hypothetical protein [Frankia canadensis]SOU58060.1 conserved hypothetical protein [Frankia canadensis]